MAAPLTKILSGMLILLGHSVLHAQSPEVTSLVVLMSKEEKSPEIDQAPSFPGGDQALNKHCLAYLQEGWKKAGMNSLRITGYEVYVSFQLSDTGEIDQIKLLKSTPSLPEMDVKVLELVRQMPNWSPCLQDDKGIPIGIGLQLKYNPKAINLITD
jgi:hypothetical protein